MSYSQATGEVIVPQHAIQVLHELTGGRAIVSTGVGQHQMFAAQWYTFDDPRRWVTSGGLGTMGFGLPSAIGAAAGHPDAVVVDIDGDGSFLMNIQELATLHAENIPVKCLVLNNQHLGMVVQWEDRFYKVRGRGRGGRGEGQASGRQAGGSGAVSVGCCRLSLSSPPPSFSGQANHAHTYLGSKTGDWATSHNEVDIFPDFPAVAAGFRVPAARVTRRSELRAAIQKMLDTPGPYLLDVMVPHKEHVRPMIPGGGSFKDTIYE